MLFEHESYIVMQVNAKYKILFIFFVVYFVIKSAFLSYDILWFIFKYEHQVCFRLLSDYHQLGVLRKKKCFDISIVENSQILC